MIDLHSHSTISDGLLTPSGLVQHAHSKGIKVLALTDHDDLEGLKEAASEANLLGMHLVHGVEISVTSDLEKKHNSYRWIKCGLSK